MAFIKRTWLARIGTGLNKFIIGEKDGNNKQTLTNSPDSVTQQGDVISADNLNDLENRIQAGFNEKQDTLTFDNVPTSNSNNPVKSGGIYTQLAGKQNTLTFDDAPTSGSSNPVKSSGIFTALSGKQNSLVVEELSAHPDWTSVTAGTLYTIDISAVKTGYTCIGVVGYNISALKSNMQTAKMSVMGIYYGSANQSVFVDVVAIENASVEYNYTRVVVCALYVKNS